MLNWNNDIHTIHLISAIADRYLNLLKLVEIEPPKKFDLLMDIEAAHSNGCPLQLEKLLESDKTDFMHDINGIRFNINRHTGKLENCFVPRYAV